MALASESQNTAGLSSVLTGEWPGAVTVCFLEVAGSEQPATWGVAELQPGPGGLAQVSEVHPS